MPPPEPDTPHPDPAASGEAASPVVRAALDLMHDAFRDLDGPEDLADRMGVPIAALRRAFARDLGAAPRSVLEAVRVREAQRLLRETGLRISEVADAVGWRRADTAARVFHRVTGQTMREYRRAARREA